MSRVEKRRAVDGMEEEREGEEKVEDKGNHKPSLTNICKKRRNLCLSGPRIAFTFSRTSV